MNMIPRRRFVVSVLGVLGSGSALVHGGTPQPVALMGSTHNLSVVVRQGGRVLSGRWIAVDDGLSRTCFQSRSDVWGRVRVTSRVMGPAGRNAVVRFLHEGREVARCAFTVRLPSVIRVSSLRLRNRTSKPVRAELRGADGSVMEVRLNPGESKQVLREPARGFRWSWIPSVWAGEEIGLPFVGGQVLVSNRGEAEATFYGGVGLLRFGVVASQDSVGGCWMPELGASSVASLGGALCVSTTGASVGLDASAGGRVIGASVKFASW